MKDVMNRTQQAWIVARRVSAAVADVAPAGLGHWQPAWEIVEEPSQSFLDALEAWELYDGSNPHRDQRLRDEIQTAANTVVQAWARAAREWEKAGRPRPDYKDSTTGLAAHA